jgi:aerobic carbon-monoxide dehydrogenase medium subunit
VKASWFDYERPRSVSDAVGLLKESSGSAKLLAGGQSLAPMINLGLVHPQLIVDLSGIPDLRRVEEQRDHLFIGATVTHAELEDGKLPDTTLGMLRHVAGCIASRGVRNRGTIGGNLAHCDPAADWTATLLALGAEHQVIGTTAQRRVPVSDFVRGPFTTALASDEVLEGVTVPRLSQRARWSYYRVRRAADSQPEVIGAVVIDPERNFCRAVLSGTKHIPRNLSVFADGIGDGNPADFASKFDLKAATEAVIRSGLGEDPIETQIYGTVLYRAVRRAFQK